MPAPVPDLAQHPLLKALAHALRHRCRLAEGERVVVAVSGGCDSVALLRAMAVLAPRRTWNLTLAVGHVQHHLRPQAEGDAAFVEALAQELDLPFFRADLDLSQSRENIEAAARGERYAALQVMADTFSARYVLTAHQADDQLETLLMRMLRGSSIRGLRGIAWRRSLGPNVWALRPMLAADRSLARAFLEQAGQSWREDHTNADLSRLRAQFRHQVLPVIRQIRPDAARRAVDLGEHFRQVQQLLDQAIARAADHVLRQEGSLLLDRAEARLLAPVVRLGLLQRLLSEAGAPPDRLSRKTLAALSKAISDGQGGQRQFQLGKVRVVLEARTLRVVPGPVTAL